MYFSIVTAIPKTKTSVSLKFNLSEIPCLKSRAQYLYHLDENDFDLGLLYKSSLKEHNISKVNPSLLVEDCQQLSYILPNMHNITPIVIRILPNNVSLFNLSFNITPVTTVKMKVREFTTGTTTESSIFAKVQKYNIDALWLIKNGMVYFQFLARKIIS